MQITQEDKKIIDYWHPSKNADKSPFDFTTGSSYNAWWKCPACGYEWQTKISHKFRGDKCPVCSGRKVIKGKNDLLSQNPNLAAQWDNEKNSLGPDEVYYKFSNKKFWWICDKGHSFDAKITNRLAGTRCPYCINQKVLNGYNDLQTKYPEIASEWNYQKNSNLIPEETVYGSNISVWWKCKTCGREWKAPIVNRTLANTGCPDCGAKRGGKKNSTNASEKHNILDEYPVIANEFHPILNGNIDLRNISPKSNIKYWWKCSKCGYEWQAKPNARINGTGCPACANKIAVKGLNDLQTNYPEIAKEWHTTKNEDVNPDMVVSGSNKIFWWKCSECGNEWRSSVNSRTRGRGCKLCGRNKATQKLNKTLASKNNFVKNYPDIASEWCYELNGEDKPENYASHSNKEFWWECSFCGNRWKSSINTRTSKGGCPKCSFIGTSFPEQAIFFYVKQYFPDAINRDRSYNYEFDIFIPSISTAIEYDGVYYHNIKGATEKENKKDRFCIKNGIKLIRIRDFSLPDTECSIRINIKDAKIKYLSNALTELFSLLGISNYKNPDIDNDRIKILSSFRRELIKNSVGTLYPHLVDEWFQEKNGNITPFNTTVSSNLKVWWKCHICNFEWRAAVSDRTRPDATSCPACAGKKVVKGFNDLESKNPYLASQWHPTLNGSLNSDMVTSNSSKSVWWLCPVCGGEWKASPSTRNGQGCGCPVCAGKVIKVGFNDLATTNPELLNEWNYERNGEITPHNTSKGSSIKIWWKCKNGHEWQSLIHNRINGNGCPHCYEIKRQKSEIIEGQIEFDLEK